MNKKLFLQKIREETMENSYKKRLQEELNDHMEDIKGSDHPESEETIIKNMGKPELISNLFNEATSPQSTVQKMIEALYISMTSLLLYIFCFVIIMMFGVDGMANDFSLLNRVGLAFVGVIIMQLIFYGLTLPKLIRSNNSKSFIKLTPLLIVFPFVETLLLMHTIIEKYIFTEETGGFILLLIVSGIFILGILSMMVVLFWTKWQEKRIKKAKNITKYFRITIPVLNIILIILIIKDLITRQIGKYPNFFPESLFNYFLYPKEFIDFIIKMSIIGTSNQYNLVTWTQIAGLLFLSLAVISLFGMVKYAVSRGVSKKEASFPWWKLTVFIYTVSTLFLSPVKETSINWQIPAHGISETIEKQQTHIFYKFFKFLYYNDGPLFSYQINKENNGFLILQQDQKLWKISDIRSVSEYTISELPWKEPEQSTDWTLHHELPPEDMKCVNDYGAGDFNGPLFTCAELHYHDKVIFRQPEEENVSMAAILMSSDEKWALIRLSYFSGDPESVYLVDLQ